MPLLLKYLLSLLIIILLSIFGFYALVLAAFGNSDFYVLITIISYIFLIIMIPLSLIFKLLRKKISKVLWIVFLGGIAVSCSIYEGRKFYDKSIVRIKENMLDLGEYAPFSANTKAASLDIESRLKMTENLPRLDGATALYPIYAAFAQAVYPKAEYPLHDGEVMCNNTIQAYENIINGNADIIFAAHASKEQLEYAQEKNVELKFTPIGKEAFVFFVNAKNPLNSLSTEQIQDIYSGKITNWKELGGKKGEIIAFQRNQNSGSQTAFVHFMQDKPIMTPPMDRIVGAMQPVIERASDYTNYANSIGFSFRFYANEMLANKGIKLLNLNNIEPNVENIKNEQYPLASYFYAVTRADDEREQINLFLQWILSEQGQSLIEKTGYNPLNQ